MQNTPVCINVVEEEGMAPMNASSAGFAAGTDEFAAAQVTKAACKEIACSRVALSPAALECKLTQVIKAKGESNYVVIGEVIGVHIRDDCLNDGKFDPARFGLVGRLGYRDYVVVRDYVEMQRPDE